MGYYRRQQRLSAIVEEQEAGWFEQRRGTGGIESGAHAWVNDRQEDVDERAAGEEGVDEAEPGAEKEAASADDPEDGVVGKGEQQPEDEVERVADCLGADPVCGYGGAEEEGDVHARQAELAGRTQDRRQHDCAGETADDRSPDQ